MSAVCEVGAADAQLRAYRQIIDLADVVLAVYDRDTLPTGSAEDSALAYACLLYTSACDIAILRRKAVVADHEIGSRFIHSKQPPLPVCDRGARRRRGRHS